MSRLGDVLRVARKARGLTQAEVCADLSMTQAALSRYENDLRTPDDETLARFAVRYQVTAEFLRCSKRLEGALAADAHMRRRRTTKASVWRHLEARLNMYRMHASLLYEEISVRADNMVPTFDLEETSPADAARMTRAQWRLPVGPVRHLIRWLEAAGCLVLEEDFGTTRVDGLSQWAGDYPVILLNGRLPTDRRRLTLAHELGHLALHNAAATADPEGEATEFAAELLMPAHVIEPQLGKLTLGRLVELKRYWGVSMQAIYERAYQLGKVGADDRAKFYRALNARGWKTNEPASDTLPLEAPELAKQVGESMRRQGLTDDEVARLAGFGSGAEDNPFLERGRSLQLVGSSPGR